MDSIIDRIIASGNKKSTLFRFYFHLVMFVVLPMPADA